MIHLRGFNKQDLDHFYKLDQMCFAPGIAYSQAELKYLVESSRSFTWVAEGADQILAGFIVVERRRNRGGLTGHIITIDVAPEFRRRGTGRLLLEAAERQLRQEGATLMILEVAEDNAVAQNFYGRFGFSEVGRIPNYYAGRIAARVMEKAI